MPEHLTGNLHMIIVLAVDVRQIEQHLLAIAALIFLFDYLAGGAVNHIF